MASNSKSPSVIKDTSLRTLKQKMQKNSLNQAPYDIRTDSYKSPPQRMSGPTVDMINNTSSYESNCPSYGPGYSSPSDKFEYRTNGSNRFAVPPSEPNPTSGARNGNPRTSAAQQLSTAGYSRKEIEERTAAADRLYQQHQQQQLQQQQLQQQHQQSLSSSYRSQRDDHMAQTLPEMGYKGSYNNSNSNNNQGRSSLNSNQNDIHQTFSQSFPGNIVPSSSSSPTNASSSNGKLSAQQQMQQQQQLYSQVQQQIQTQPGLPKRNSGSNATLPSYKGSRDSYDDGNGGGGGGVTITVGGKGAAGGGGGSDGGWDQRRIVEVGLDNLGNTCFMNSTLQCLLHIQPLVKFFLTANVEQQLNLASPQKGVLATSFCHLVQDMYRKQQPGSNVSISPINFQKAVGTYAPYLMDYSQQDSQEFLRFLLDGMSEDLCRKHSSIAVDDVQPGRSEPINRVGGPHSISGMEPQMSPTTAQLGTSNSRRSLQNNHHDSPYNTPGLEDSAVFSVASNATATKKGSILPVLPSMHGATQALSLQQPQQLHGSDSALTVNTSYLVDESDSREVPTPTAVTSKLRLVSEISAARKNRALSGESETGLHDEDDLNSIHTEATSDEEMSQSQRDISGNIRNVVQNRRSIRMRKSKSGEDEGTNANSKLSSEPSSSSNAKNRVVLRNGVRISEDSNRAHSPPLQINTALSPNIKSPPPPSTAPAALTVPPTPHSESALAWKRYLKLNDSVITDIFAGQLQSTIECLTCRHRSSTYDPFLDLAVPISKETESGGTRGFMSAMKNAAGVDNKSTLEKCLVKFTAEEVLDGDNMYQCEKCKAKRKSVKKLSIFKYPKVLVIQIKRFRFNSTSREKLSTDVHFPLTGLDLSSYVSPDIQLRRSDGDMGGGGSSSSTSAVPSRPVTVSNNQVDSGESSSSFRGGNSISSNSGRDTGGSFIMHSRSMNDTTAAGATSVGGGGGGGGGGSCGDGTPLPIYDLVGVSNHHGSLHGGHYIAHVDTNFNSRVGGETTETAPRWMCFNDARVSNANASSIAGPTAYVLFYKIRE